MSVVVLGANTPSKSDLASAACAPVQVPCASSGPNDLAKDAPVLAAALADPLSDPLSDLDGNDELPAQAYLDALPDVDLLLDDPDTQDMFARLDTMTSLNTSGDPMGVPFLHMLPDLDDLPKLDSIDDVLEYELLEEKAWVELQRSWQFDACLLPAEYAVQVENRIAPRIPSLFVFVGTVSHLLSQAGYISQAVSANKLFSGYLAQQDSNLQAIEYMNHAVWLASTPGGYNLTVKDGRVALELECRMSDGTIQTHTFDPMVVFGATTFVLDESYVTTPAFSATFLQGQIRVIYANSITCGSHRLPPCKSVSSSVSDGTFFDHHFPAIAQPRALASQFQPPPPLDSSPAETGLVYMGFTAFSVAIVPPDPQAQAPPSSSALCPVWDPTWPRVLLSAGTFTNPAFSPLLKLPCETQIQHMWTLLSSAAQTNLLLARAMTAAQQVRALYSSGPDYLMRFKMICVTWRILQHMLIRSKSLFQLMIRTFCYASCRQLGWRCVQTKMAHVRFDIPQVTPSRRQGPTVGVMMAWNVTASTSMNQWIKQQTQAAIDSWWFVCPFTIYDKSLVENPELTLGRAFKITPT